MNTAASSVDCTIFVHARASECRREGAYAVVIEDGKEERILCGKVQGPPLTSIRTHLFGVISALGQTPGENEKIVLYSNLEAFVAPFNAADLRSRFYKGTLANPDLWIKIIELCANRRVEVCAVSMKCAPPENMVRASKASLQAFRNPDLIPDIDVEPDYPNLFSNITNL